MLEEKDELLGEPCLVRFCAVYGVPEDGADQDGDAENSEKDLERKEVRGPGLGNTA